MKKKKTPNTTSFSLYDEVQPLSKYQALLDFYWPFVTEARIPPQLPKSTQTALLTDSTSLHSVREAMEMRQLSASLWFYPPRWRTNDVRHKLKKGNRTLE